MPYNDKINLKQVSYVKFKKNTAHGRTTVYLDGELENYDIEGNSIYIFNAKSAKNDSERSSEINHVLKCLFERRFSSKFELKIAY